MDSSDQSSVEYKLGCTVMGGYVCVRVEGSWPAERPEEILGKIYNAWASNPMPGLLIDIRHSDDVPKVYLDYQTGHALSDAGFGKIARIAILDGSDRRAANEFLETTAYNRGVRLNFFYGDEQEVIDWFAAGEKATNG